jgi:hypothetical protein
MIIRTGDCAFSARRNPVFRPNGVQLKVEDVKVILPLPLLVSQGWHSLDVSGARGFPPP